MKRVVTNEELRLKMREAIALLCDSVKMTLGPKGRNVILDHSMLSPFITNDGVTIAENIESEDLVVETILELAKESSLKTNELVGDGTTTTLVFLQSLFQEGMAAIEEGIHPMVLKKELESTLKNLLKVLDSYSHSPSKEELIAIASVSANDKEIGALVGKAFLKVKDKNAIEIVEGTQAKTELLFKQGYQIETILASPYFLKEDGQRILHTPYLFLYNGVLEEKEDLADLLNEVILRKGSLVLFAEDYSEYFVHEMVSLYLDEGVDLILLKQPEFGARRFVIMNDLALISGAQIVQSMGQINFSVLGQFSSLEVHADKTNFLFLATKDIKKKIACLKKQFPVNEFDRDFHKKRIAMFTKGTLQISVGAYTQVERREKKMRFEDAVCAISVASLGVVVGGGLTFYLMALSLDEDSLGNRIWKKVLQVPMKQIFRNAGLDEESILNAIEKEKYQVLYNVADDCFEKIIETQVLDAKKVLSSALIHACSIASMLLTTSSLVLNESSVDKKRSSLYEDL